MIKVSHPQRTRRVAAGSADDGFKYVGINIAYGIAKGFQYLNLPGLNVLVMRI